MSSSLSGVGSSSAASLFGTSSTSSSSSSSGSGSSSSSSSTTTSEIFNADGSITIVVKDSSGNIVSETKTGGSSQSGDTASEDLTGIDTLA
ncbi:hypothetical protein K2X14_04480 [Acetobacter sp. TBRC 12305]|uniref:Uncharacterized protein n=1 Tax=Acetobacter garciniae TaxID=2817435 RepID=A0A939HN20_9PROT|nr:hypothetical protein [Acetobacter garciniae]MBO1324412.1 hypothetical protein [Acetobacter garciniae]MBX0344101.1 hypothetical protein [Acetobacter garciniae]